MEIGDSQAKGEKVHATYLLIYSTAWKASENSSYLFNEYTIITYLLPTPLPIRILNTFTLKVIRER